MELTGAIQALTHLRDVSGPLSIHTDSTYVIQGIEQWVHNWKRRGWKTATGGEVMNREYWEELSSLTAARPPGSIAWHYVRGHIGIPGNERVDEIADAFAVHGHARLYDGPLVHYGFRFSTSPATRACPRAPGRRAAAQAAARRRDRLIRT